MRPSRAVIKAGLALTTIASAIVANWPRIAVWVANLGDRLSDLGMKLACYGR